MLSIAKALGLITVTSSHQKIDSQLSAKIFGNLRRLRGKTLTKDQLRSETWNDVMTQVDLFQDELLWTFIAGRIAAFTSCHQFAFAQLKNIKPDVSLESRNQWLERILGEHKLDDLDAFDDIVSRPNELLGMIDRYDLYLRGCSIASQSHNNLPNRSLGKLVVDLRDQVPKGSKKLPFAKIGEQLGISKQRAHVLYAEQKSRAISAGKE